MDIFTRRKRSGGLASLSEDLIIKEVKKSRCFLMPIPGTDRYGL